MRLDKITRAAVDALEDIRARDVQVYDVKKRTAYFDRVIVATGDSNRQCRALHPFHRHHPWLRPRYFPPLRITSSRGA